MTFFFQIFTISFISALIFAMSSAYPLGVEDQVQDPSNIRAQRQAGGHHHHDVVDFGAHTGDHGAFGWYADYPVHHHK